MCHIRRDYVKIKIPARGTDRDTLWWMGISFFIGKGGDIYEKIQKIQKNE